MTRRTLRVAAILATLAGVALAGAAGVRGADPSLGATVEADVYVSEDAHLTVWNRSTVEARFDFQPTGGWLVEPSSVVLAPDASAAVAVSGRGDDGAPVSVVVHATAPVPPGHSESVVVVEATIYHARPFDPSPWIWGAFWIVAMLIVVVLAAREARRLLRGYDFSITRRLS